MNPPDRSEALQIIHSRIAKIASSNPTLYSGLAGKSLFYYYFNRFDEKAEYLRIATDSLQSVLDNLHETSQQPSLADGFTGIAWLLQHLSAEGFTGEPGEEEIAGFDGIIEKSLSLYQSQGNYDPLYGAIGAGIYFLERKQKGNDQLRKIISLLHEMAIGQNDDRIWLSRIPGVPPAEKPDLGLSHGIPGIIVFLVRSYERLHQFSGSENNQLLQELSLSIEQLVTWLIGQQLPFGMSFYPNHASIQQESRLGWSYGDLGVAYCLLYAGRVFDRKDWVDQGIQIGHHTISRDPENSQMYRDYEAIPDAGFCNGSAGIATLYDQLYFLSGDESFKDRRIFWEAQTIKSVIRAYQAYGLENAPVSQVHWWNDISLIKGLSGIGLSLLKGENLKKDWKRALLLF